MARIVRTGVCMESPSDKMRRFIWRWLRGPNAIRAMMGMAEDLRLQRVHPMPDSKRLCSFVGMVTAWAAESRRPSGKIGASAKAKVSRLHAHRHPWKGAV